MYLKCINKVQVKEILLPMIKQYCQFIKEVVEVSTEVMLLSSGRLYGTFEVGFAWYSHPRKFGTTFIFESSTKTFLGGAVHDTDYIVYTIIYSTV